ncbi:RagB/SusD family nutrient uptake outer membrane protein [Parabacteroides sp. Marseille-P3160]|uniref:RagB/SusD family nutrient uptake outer membrane protein n=1 Tax=Parabacteroides sp. Marseille-P3160 TaxID=1917887 RepID=UPI0009BA66E4|nr:RagB/SusD family nutrient uptake outer membrane protein [Parabacteroides sp. Marseille-P3160]
MKSNRIYKYIAGAALIISMLSCTNLDEKVYDQVVTENYYNTKEDVIRAYVRPFEHGFWSISPMYELQEGTADQQATYNREGWWLDGQKYQRLHYHTWTIDDSSPQAGWNGNFQGITQCNSVIDDFEKLNPEKFGMTQDEFDQMEYGLKTMRAWFYIRLLDLFRNIPLAVSTDQSLNSKGQVTPQEAFDFIESELKEALELLPVKEGTGGNKLQQGQWTKAAAAALLVRLYLNAEKWIGKAMYSECATYAQKIIDGEYGTYALATRWDEPFDWNNETSDEIIFAFTAGYSRAHWHMGSDMYWWSLPANAHYYFGFKDWGGMNPKYALQPSRNVDGNLYDFSLGMPVARFQEYPEDYRLKKYKNLSGESKREGMFLYGYLEYADDPTKRVTAPNAYEYYIRDQVGMFKGASPETIIADKESNMNHADHNSGWHPVKYPIYRDNDPGAMEADYAEIRLAEIYYSLAESKFRTGDVTGAGKLLNDVRKRNYPADKYSEYLYQPDGKVILTADELLNEWGREFIVESRRRTDLCRWNKFSTGSWWDKQPDADSHTDIFPLSRTVLNSNPALVQNPGYDF